MIPWRMGPSKTIFSSEYDLTFPAPPSLVSAGLKWWVVITRIPKHRDLKQDKPWKAEIYSSLL